MDGEYDIPQDIYDRVLELMVSIVNATAVDDSVMEGILKQQLLDYCQEQTAAGHGSGFLWEAIGDVTQDPGEKMVHYQRALTYALHNREPTHTVLLEIGKLYAEAGETEKARIHYESALREAIERGDLDREGSAAASLISLENSQFPDAG